MRKEEFFFEILQQIIIQLKLPPQRPIRHSPLALKPGERLRHHFRKFHPRLLPQYEQCLPHPTANGASEQGAGGKVQASSCVRPHRPCRLSQLWYTCCFV